MNYYEHHIGDFLKKTVHLTAVEEGIYRRLLDRYYTTERPLPVDVRECCKLARASSKAERDAVRDVLKDFFSLQEDGHHQNRADQEIARFQEKSAKAKRSAEARWNASKPQSEGNANAYANASDESMRTHCEGNATRARPHTPDTSNQSPDLNTNTHTAPATDGGRVCRLLRKTGIPDANPGHPDLLSLIAAGASDAEFENAGRTAADKGKGFAYALGVLKGQRTEAAEAAKRMHHGALPAAAPGGDRKSRQLETAALMTGAARATPQQQPETIDVESRVIAPRVLG